MRIDELIRRFCQEVDASEPLFVSLEREGALRGMLEHSVPSSASSSGACLRSMVIIPRCRLLHLALPLVCPPRRRAAPLRGACLRVPKRSARVCRRGDLCAVTKAKDRRKSVRRNASKSTGAAAMVHTGLRSSPMPVAIVPPEIADGATDEFDDDLRPLSRHELQKLHISGKQQYLGGEL